LQELKVEYSQYWSGSHLALGWRPAAAEIGLTKAIPSDALYHDPPPPGPVFDPPAGPGADGAVTLHAAAARMYGGPRLHRLNDRDPGYVANWTRLSAWVGWDLHAPRGAYDVEIELSCDGTNAGSEYAVSIGPYRLESTVPDSGGWGQFVTRTLGRIRLAEGPQSLRIKPTSRSHKVLMDVRRVTLTPVKVR
jgi:hypothetical protein